MHGRRRLIRGQPLRQRFEGASTWCCWLQKHQNMDGTDGIASHLHISRCLCHHQLLPSDLLITQYHPNKGHLTIPKRSLGRTRQIPGQSSNAVWFGSWIFPPWPVGILWGLRLDNVGYNNALLPTKTLQNWHAPWLFFFVSHVFLAVFFVSFRLVFPLYPPFFLPILSKRIPCPELGTKVWRSLPLPFEPWLMAYVCVRGINIAGMYPAWWTNFLLDPWYICLHLP